MTERWPGCGAGTPVAALLYEDEVVSEVPVDSWDVAVGAVVTPAGWRDLKPAQPLTQRWREFRPPSAIPACVPARQRQHPSGRGNSG